MVAKSLSNPQALYGLQWDDGSTEVCTAINASGRTLYTGDVVVLANNTNAIAGPLVAGSSNNTAGQLVKGNIVVPAVSLTTIANDKLVWGVVGSRETGYVDTIPGGVSGQVGTSTLNNAGVLTGVTAQANKISIYPSGGIVDVVRAGVCRVHDGAQASATTSVASLALLTTTVGSLGNPGASGTGTIGNLLGISMETSVWSAANAQTGDADVSNVALTGLTVVAGTTAASATTIATATDPRSAANDAPSNKPTTGIFPNTGVIQIVDGTTTKVVAYSAIGSGGFTVSATTVATGITAGSIITYVQSTIRALVKLA